MIEISESETYIANGIVDWYVKPNRESSDHSFGLTFWWGKWQYELRPETGRSSLCANTTRHFNKPLKLSSYSHKIQYINKYIFSFFILSKNLINSSHSPENRKIPKSLFFWKTTNIISIVSPFFQKIIEKEKSWGQKKRKKVSKKVTLNTSVRMRIYNIVTNERERERAYHL
jgi:hypothetical protein